MLAERRLAGIVVWGAVALFLGLPLAALALTAVELGGLDLGRADGTLATAVWGSLWTGAAATALAVVAGSSLAVLTERTALGGRGGLRLAMLVALVVPGYIAALAWQRAYGPVVIGPTGIVAVLAVESAPICYFVVAAGLAGRVDPDAERAARMAGAGWLTALRTVTLPLAQPSIAAAAAIAFVLNVTAFGTPAVLGIPAGFATMTTQIYRDLAFAAEPAAFGRAIGLALVLAAMAATLLGVAGLLVRDAAARPSAPSGPRGHRVLSTPRGPRAWLAAGVAWLFVALGVVVPLIALALTALTRAPGLPPVPESLTLDNFARVLDGHTRAAFVNSLLLSLAAAAVVVLLSGLALAARSRWSRAAALSFALPGTTLALAVLLAYGPLLRDSLAIILLAYVAKLWLLGWRPLAGARASIGTDAVHAARMAGASAWTAARTITLPLLRPTIVAAALLVFLFAMHEVTMSSLLYGPATRTLAVAVLNLQQLGDPTLTAALAVLVGLAVGALGLPVLARLSGAAGSGWRP